MNTIQSLEEFLSRVSPLKTAVIWASGLLIFLIFLVILTVRLFNSLKTSAQNNGRINQYLAAVPPEQIGTISAVYQNTRKSLGLAMILSIVGGGYGLQRAYLGRRKSAVMMFLFFWSGIPTIISIFDLVNMPKTVSEFNLTVARSLYEQIAVESYTNAE